MTHLVQLHARGPSGQDAGGVRGGPAVADQQHGGHGRRLVPGGGGGGLASTGRERPRKLASTALSGFPSSTCCTSARTSSPQPACSPRGAASRAPSQPTAPPSAGPQDVSSQDANRNGPPGAGASPAKASARNRCSQLSRFTTSVDELARSSTSSASSSTSPTSSAGSPSASRNDDTVQPARLPSAAAAPPARPPSAAAAQTLTPAGTRPRSRRSGSRSPSGGRNGCSA